MGLTICGEWKDAPEWDMGYGSFFRLRRDIAYSVSEEFGDHYANLIHLYHFNDDGSYDKETERLIRKYHCKKRFLDFLYSPDAGYRLSPKKCEAVLNQIAYGEDSEEHGNIDTLYGYTAYPERCMKLSDFICLLVDCRNRKKYLVWY